MSKITKTDLLDFIQEQADKLVELTKVVELNKRAIIKLENESENPQLKQVDQSVFIGLDSKWKYAAVDGVGTLKAFTYEPKLAVSRTGFILLIGSTMDIGTGYDASNWRDSLIKRESAKPQPKQLDHSMFKEWDDCWKYFAIDENGDAWRYKEKPKIDRGDNRWSPDNTVPLLIGKGYDTTNWRNSLTKRDIAKELLEVDLSSGLTGSELCRAMLARGDKYVMCKVSNMGDSEVEADIAHAIRGFSQSGFKTKRNTWSYAVPINNQGEPLTASDVGI